jgi:hypothetical protein
MDAGGLIILVLAIALAVALGIVIAPYLGTIALVLYVVIDWHLALRHGSPC